MNDDVANAIQGMVAELKDRGEQAARIGELLEATGSQGLRAQLTYRCARRCTLARVYRTPMGTLIGTTRYKLSPQVNEASSVPAARAKRTEDGDRRWRGSWYFTDQAANVTVNCDHIRNGIIEITSIDNAMTAQRKNITFP